ncbi:MAG: RsiV family protein [Luteolibacter sp.]
MKLLIFLCTAALAMAEDEPKDSIRRYEGTIGKDLAISLTLHATGNETGGEDYSGSYAYKKTGIPIALTQPEGKSAMTVFVENEHWDGDKTISTGKWKVKIEGEKVTGTWSSSDGKKSLPISLTESYPAGTFRVEMVHYQSSWSRKRDRKQIGDSKAVDFLQFKGDAPGLPAINAALRKVAWEGAGELWGDEKSKAPAEVSLADVEKAVTAKQPDAIDWEAAYLGSQSSSMNVVMNESGLICVSVINSTYTGGAHENYGISNLTFDAETGKQFKLEDLVNPGFENRWATLGATEIRSACGQKPGSPLTESGLFEDKLELNQNWFLTPGGIGFSYDPYEIASFAQGVVEFTLPWKSIAADLKPGTRVEELAKKVLETTEKR